LKGGPTDRSHHGPRSGPDLIGQSVMTTGVPSFT
jgi:hypothetical protein